MQRTRPVREQAPRPAFCFLHIFACAAEQCRDAAYCRHADNCVHNPGKQTAAAKDKGYKVKVQNTYKPPVEPTHNQQGNTYFIKHIHKINPFITAGATFAVKFSSTPFWSFCRYYAQ